MTQTVSTAPAATSEMPTTTAPAALTMRPGRWIDGWDAEDTGQWEAQGRAIARRNLNWSIFAEFLGFVVWQLWSIVAVTLPKAGFDLSTGEIFWLISIPSLVGATLRIPYSFLVPKYGGRNWTIISAGLLLAPTIAMVVCVSNPETPFPVLLCAAALAGFGGGNFASSMSNITFFYPQREKGWALGLNAAGGNLGAAVAQLVVPIVITIGAGATLNLPVAGWIWIPFILIAMIGAARYMNNLSNAKADFSGSAAALKEPHLWLLSLLYIGTFGSFIGFASVFPKLIADQFPEFSAIAIGGASVSLAFLGALVGSLARPYGGRLSDRFGGARITMFAFAAMALITIAVLLTLPLASFWLFLGLFLLLFASAGIGNGSTYRMVPIVFAVRGGGTGDVSTQRKSAAALGLISAIGAYGGFLIPQALNLSFQSTGTYAAAFIGFIAAYALLLVLTWGVYVRSSKLSAHKI
ncbi:NNP family nitrate/nitrite transporter-like MFS transporter [Agromyces hippuratus]|uniref:NNP family nitrate/nitrite transporter-like MFS transporter n=1 Tax=Agromyces hippuratus TaxID=286438 RepID=A0A852WQU2_9MICO|nr:MFS transporter [Agromyces hippuratus]NYG20316.1 NNP family nitrate/nitrite transporter-like MFS transporter [Agromyces hippuratus]